MYYIKPGPRGRKLYFYAGSDGKKKMISIKEVPDAVRVALLAGTPEVDEAKMGLAEAIEAIEEFAPVDKACIFCGMHSNMPRLVNGQTVYICEEHYHTTTIGQTAAKLREVMA